MQQNRLQKIIEKIGFHRKALLGAAVLCAVAVLTLYLFSGRRAATIAAVPASEPTPLVVAGWKIDLPGESASPNAQKFSGFFGPAKVFCVPSGAAFNIISSPAEVRGELQEAPAPGRSATETWFGQGGKMSSGVPASDGMHQTARAPQQPGLYQLSWGPSPERGSLVPASASASGSAASPALCLQVLVLGSAEIETKGERTFVKVNGKSIGGYHDPLKSPVKRVREHAADYQIPKFFASLNSETARLRLGPGFELGDLIAFKDYVGADGKKVFTTERHTDVIPLRPELIEKLIKLRERLQQKGVAVTRFGITSAFRTPDYNRSIGGAVFSRHCYGDAIDLYIDEDHNHKMDDLNGDGKIDRKDGLVIANACRELELEGAVVPGGIGVYEWDGDESVRSHVHIDCRGYISRWGQIGSGKFKKTFKWWPPAEFQDEENGE